MPRCRPPRPVTLAPGLVEAAGSRLLAEVLHRRGLTTPEEAVRFLTGGFDLDDPGLPDLEEGVILLADALRAGKRICVYGDYDTDGVTSTALLVDLLRSQGGQVEYHVPDRFKEGYGMNRSVVEALAAGGTELILTCDCGIRNLEEVAAARALGLTVVVTDHHELGPELPQAHAVINPKRLPPEHPCRMLPGVGTAYLVARKLMAALGHEPSDADRWLDLVAVGIIADVVPLRAANRELGRRGLNRLQALPCPGLAALIAVAGLEGPPEEEQVAFQLVPRLNSAGRLAHAGLSVRLLLAREPEPARELASELDRLNQERKRLTAVVQDAATAGVSPGEPGILLYRPDWHEGVLGIAAGRLAEENGVPALLLARKHGTSLLVGSARAPEGFALHEALAACGQHLAKFGGHAGAAGFSLLEENLAPFRAAMREEIRRRFRPDAAAGEQEADLELPLATVDRPLYDDLRRAAPYGEANPAPLLHAPAAMVLTSRPVGPGEKHLRLVFKDGEKAFAGLWWGGGSTRVEPGPHSLFYSLALNRYRGEEQLQLMVQQLEPAPLSAPLAAPLPVGAVLPTRARPVLTDRRGWTGDLASLLEPYDDALVLGEGAGSPEGSMDRYQVRGARTLVMLTPPPSPGLLDEALALAGPRELVLAWPAQVPDEERLLPNLMRALAAVLDLQPYVSIPRLAVALAELERTVRIGIDALVESDLLAVEEEGHDQIRLRRRPDGRGVRESPALAELRRLTRETRAFRRFLRTASVDAIQQVLR